MEAYLDWQITGEGRLIPIISLPKDYKLRLKAFYEKGKKEKVEAVATSLRKSQGLDINLKWDEDSGLTNISLGVHYGLDLNDAGEFQEHNLDGKFSLAAAAIATKYVAELLKLK